MIKPVAYLQIAASHFLILRKKKDTKTIAMSESECAVLWAALSILLSARFCLIIAEGARLIILICPGPGLNSQTTQCNKSLEK